MFFVELRLRVQVRSGTVEFSQTVVLDFFPVAGLVLHLDVNAGSAEGLTITRVGWLTSRQRFVCEVTDSYDAAGLYAGDPQGLCAHYLARGWLVTGGGS